MTDKPVFRSPERQHAVYDLYRKVLDGWPVPKHELRLSTRQGETFVVACGPDDAPPLLLLHGAQSNAAAWMFNAALWSKRFRTYAVDMIGEAGFSAPSRPPLDTDAHAAWLDDVLTGLGLSKTAIVGLSLGGWLALDYAIRRPDKVDRLALICPAGVGRQKNFLLKALPLLLLGSWGERRVREMVFGPMPRELPPAAQPLADLMRLIGRAIRPRIVRIPRFTDAELGRLTMPVLAIVGGRDALLDSGETRRRLAHWAPQARVVFLPEARHVIPGQSHVILEFLEDKGLPTTAKPDAQQTGT